MKQTACPVSSASVVTSGWERTIPPSGTGTALGGFVIVAVIMNFFSRILTSSLASYSVTLEENIKIF